MDNNYEMDEMMEVETLSFGQRLIAIYTEPKKAYESLKENPKFLGAYLITLLISSIAVLWGFFDGSTEKLMIDQLVSSGQPVSDDILSVMVISGVVVGLLLMVIGPFINAFFYHILVMINSETGYKKTLSITTHASLIGALNSLITILILKVSGITIMFSPAMFMDATTTNTVVYTLLSFLNIFVFWQYFVTFVGLKTVHKLKNSGAFITLLIPNLIIIGITMLSVIIQG